MQTFDGKVVVITGASSGIGAALAEEVARRGAHVVLAARTLEKLKEVGARLAPFGGNPLVVPTDVTKRAEVERLRDEAIAKMGQVDVWVNNAGRGISRPLLQLSDEDVDTIMRDNLKSALYGMQAIVPHFQSRGEGVLANVSSGLGRVPFAPFRSIYSAAKAALNSLGETLRVELAEKYPRIHVVTIIPGVVATEFGNNALGGGPDSRTLPNAQPVDEAVRAIADGLLTRNGDLYTRAGMSDFAIGHLQKLAQG